MASLPNYITDVNPYQLAGPPSYFLKQLWEFDPSLVIIPSRQEFLYRLAQRRKINLPEAVVNDVLREEADTKMLASYGLVPVTTILATANWSNPLLFVELANRAPWRMGGAAKVNAMLEAQDTQDRLSKKAKIDEDLTYLAKDSWRYYQKKIGTRSNVYIPKTASAPAPRTHSVQLPKPTSRPDVMTIWKG